MIPSGRDKRGIYVGVGLSTCGTTFFTTAYPFLETSTTLCNALGRMKHVTARQDGYVYHPAG